MNAVGEIKISGATFGLLPLNVFAHEAARDLLVANFGKDRLGYICALLENWKTKKNGTTIFAVSEGEITEFTYGRKILSMIAYDDMPPTENMPSADIKPSYRITGVCSTCRGKGWGGIVLLRSIVEIQKLAAKTPGKEAMLVLDTDRQHARFYENCGFWKVKPQPGRGGFICMERPVRAPGWVPG